MLKKRKIILIAIALYIPALFVCRLYITYRTLECCANMKGVVSYISVYRNENKGINPAALEDMLSSSDLDKESLYCPVSGKEYLYFSDAIYDDDIFICDSVPTHPVFRKGKAGFYDLLTFRLFAPKGRVLLYRNGVEGFISESEFQKKLKEQKHLG